MKIALVHDYLVQGGGAEKVLESFCEIFPNAPIYTLVHDKKAMRGAFEDRHIVTSDLQRVPFTRKYHRSFPFLMTSAIESFDLSAYDVVLSDSSSFAKGVITSPQTLHISYVHTPMRYAWDDCQKYTSDFGLPRIVERIVPFVMNYIRMWDYASSHRVDHFLANSEFVAKRIDKYYQKTAYVIHPPVSTERFRAFPEMPTEDFYLMVGRLIAYKRHDIAIEAFNRTGKKLKIIGRGPEMESLEKKANENIKFLGRVDDDVLARYYASCKGFVFPQEEDFGIVAIEALASGRPLIAFRGGDIVEHITHRKHGVFFDEQTADSLVDAIKEFEELSFDKGDIREQAERFDKKIFQRKIKDYVEEKYKAHKKNKD